MKEFIVLYEVHDAGSMERQYTVWADTPEDAARMVITAHLPYLYGERGEQRRGATDRVVAVMERTGFLAPVSELTPTFEDDEPTGGPQIPVSKPFYTAQVSTFTPAPAPWMPKDNA